MTNSPKVPSISAPQENLGRQIDSSHQQAAYDVSRHLSPKEDLAHAIFELAGQAEDGRVLDQPGMFGVSAHGIEIACQHTAAGHARGQECSMIKTSLAPAASLRDFQVQWVFGNISPPLRQQIVALWLQEGAVPNPDEAWRRSWEVACILREVESGDVAGVCTVAIRLDDHAVSYGFVRLFIRRASRLAGLNVRLMKTMIEGFEVMVREPGAPRRLVATIENRKIERRAAQRILARLGFVHVGTAANGELVMQRSLTT